jgi:hypothetical protein
MTKKSEQISLKPQDILIALKVAISPGASFTYASLGNALGMSPSQVHAGVKRATISRLMATNAQEGFTAIRPAIYEFTIHGLRYAFPAITGAIVRGLPTAFAAPPLQQLISQAGQVLPVWPHPAGNTRGYALFPIYPSVPAVCTLDPDLYEVLTLIDALRIGAARERELAVELLKKWL